MRLNFLWIQARRLVARKWLIILEKSAGLRRAPAWEERRRIQQAADGAEKACSDRNPRARGKPQRAVCWM